MTTDTPPEKNSPIVRYTFIGVLAAIAISLYVRFSPDVSSSLAQQPITVPTVVVPTATLVPSTEISAQSYIDLVTPQVSKMATVLDRVGTLIQQQKYGDAAWVA